MTSGQKLETNPITWLEKYGDALYRFRPGTGKRFFYG